MSTEVNLQKGFQWDQYWSNGNIHSLTNAFSGNYEGAIAEFWKLQFSQLQDGSNILDIGTGNGAVAFIAADVAKKRGIQFNIHAIDLAKIDPVSATKKHPELQKLLDYIHFQGGISAAKLPFENDCFELIVGQYSLEYTPLESTMGELKRVVKDKGRLCFIMHHQDSIIMRTSRDEIEQAKLIFEETQLFSVARSLIRVIGDANTPEKREKLKYNPTAEKWRESLNSALATLDQRVQSSEDPTFLLTTMNYVVELFKSKAQLSCVDKLNYLTYSEDLIRGNLDRIQDLYGACFNSQKAQKFQQLALNEGFELPIVVDFYNENRQLMGVSVVINPCTDLTRNTVKVN
ncbi:MAG: hypothetical protein COW84_06200 [Gammaproteobacteria bacterium CG22_combo_CG10-13_8_21_14_all_40_8]|nr:MAG: hypothetical protein COW84_06200 [Gammaproteobacteria bacterium CG22_combo_CG10-13_8_21_14_all_40_8]